MLSIKDQRVELGLSQMDVAKALCMSRPTYNSRECGDSDLTLNEAMILKGMGILAFPRDTDVLPAERLAMQVDAMNWLIGRCEDQMVRAWLILNRQHIQDMGGTPERGDRITNKQEQEK